MNTTACKTYKPLSDIVEGADEFQVIAELPGVERDSIEIHFEKNELRLSAKISEERSERGNFLMHEYGVGDYERSFVLGDGIDGEAITAEFKDGVLTLRLPKRETSKARRIEIGQN